MNKKLTLLLGLSICVFAITIAQNSMIYSGRVIDNISKEPLYFASITLSGAPYGTTTDERGYFKLKIVEQQRTDSLVVSFIGYNYLKIPVARLDSFSLFKLQPNAVNLEEVLVLPLSAEEYIKRAVGKIKANYTSRPYQSLAYYKEKLTENDHFIKQEEAIFKSYHYAVKDTSKVQHQVVNHRKVRKVKELQFMRDKMEKEYKQEVKKAKRKSDTTEIAPPDFSMENVFNGPNMILSLNLKKGLPEFIDTNSLDQFKYSFGPSTSMLQRDIILINYKSKGKYNHMRSGGQIYLDANTYAFVRLTFKGEFVAPLWLKPILFLYGLRIIDPIVAYQTDYQLSENAWYPKNFWWNIDTRMVKTHWFSENERSNFHIGQVYVVNEIKREGISPISEEKRYSSKKKMEEQVFPEKGIDWFGN